LIEANALTTTPDHHQLKAHNVTDNCAAAAAGILYTGASSHHGESITAAAKCDYNVSFVIPNEDTFF